MHLEAALRAALLGVSFLVLLACSSEHQPNQWPPPDAAPSGPTSVAVRPEQLELTKQLRQRVSKLPAFTRLPSSDQAWVLEKAGARLDNPDAPEVTPLVQQLAEVRQFAVAEREEPMPTPRLDTPEVP